MAILHYIKNCRLVQAKRNVLNKAVSRADETPTFDEDFLDTKLELKNKHQNSSFFNVFVDLKNYI